MATPADRQPTSRPRGPDPLRTLFRRRFPDFQASYEQHYAAAYGKFRLPLGRGSMPPLITRAASAFRVCGDWVHAHTRWKTFIPSCGAVIDLVPSFVEAGFDILNPVRLSAARMDARVLKERFGRQVTFWSGGVDTQKTLPFGTPAKVRREVAERLEVLAPGGGFLFNPVHNVQAGVPVENLRAMYDTVRERGAYR